MDFSSTRSRLDICMGFIAFINAMILCARSQDSVPSVSVRRVHFIFSTACFKGGGKLCYSVVYMVWTALITAKVLCARFQDLFVHISAWGKVLIRYRICDS